MTSPLLTDDDFEDEPTLLVQDSRVNLIALRENVLRLVMSVTYGERSSEFWAKQNPNGSWERTSQDSLPLNLEPSSGESSVTWPRWGTAWAGVAMEHLTLAQSTGESGYSSLLGTPNARDYKGRGRAGQLPTQLLPTARASDSMAKQLKVYPSGIRGRLEQAIAEEYLPTPRANKPGGFSGNGFSPTLHETLMLATPAAADAQGSHGGGQGRSLRTDVHTYKAETGESGTLNSSFVAAMMGFPDSWFEIE